MSVETAEQPVIDSAEAQPATSYELDLEAPAADLTTSTESSTPAATTPADAPSAGPLPDYARDAYARAEAAERTVNEMRSQFAPILDERMRSAAEAARRPPVTLERLNSGEATAQELMAYIDWQNNQGLSAIRQAAALEARRAASEATVRGQFSASTLGAGRDYDTMRATYLEPSYRQNPQIRQAIEVLSPESPAVGEMYVAAFLHARELAGGDDVKALKSIFNAIGARTEAQTEVTNSIQEAARRGADKMQRSRGPGATAKKIDSKALWSMTDAEFRQLQRQQTGL